VLWGKMHYCVLKSHNCEKSKTKLVTDTNCVPTLPSLNHTYSMKPKINTLFPIPHTPFFALCFRGSRRSTSVNKEMVHFFFCVDISPHTHSQCCKHTWNAKMLMLTFTVALRDWAIHTCEGDLRSRRALNILSESRVMHVRVCVDDI